MTLKFLYIIKAYRNNVTITVVLNQRDSYRNTTNVTAKKYCLELLLAPARAQAVKRSQFTAFGGSCRSLRSIFFSFLTYLFRMSPFKWDAGIWSWKHINGDVKSGSFDPPWRSTPHSTVLNHWSTQLQDIRRGGVTILRIWTQRDNTYTVHTKNKAIGTLGSYC